MRSRFICFVGCDGSGKSTVIRQILERLNEENKAVLSGHWRPGRLRAGGATVHADAATDPHRSPPRGVLGSCAKLVLIGLDWWFWALRGEKKMTIFDRFHGDLLVDPVRYRYGGAMWIARVWQRCLPRPDLLIYLSAPPEVLLSRKREVTEDVLRRSACGYTRLLKGNGQGVEIDASQPVADVVEDVWAVIEKGRYI